MGGIGVTMKKTIVIGLAAGLILTMLLAGCKKKQQTSDVPITIDPSSIEETSVAEPASEILGGWETNSDYTPVLTDEEKEIYEEGVKGLDGLSYEPVTVLATQVVSGMNYAFLVYGNDTEAKASGESELYAIAIVWKDSKGTSTLMNLTKINPADLHVKEMGDDLVGGWSVVAGTEPGMLPAEDAQSSFDAVTADLGKTFNPVALIATQLVSGNNYVAISKGSDGQLYLSQWYRDLQGNAQMSVHGVLDWEYYNP